MMDIIAGTVGGVAGIAACQPFDTVKVRLQTELELAKRYAALNNGAVRPAYKGPVDCAVTMLRTEGIRSFYKGMVSPIVSNAPINAIVFGVERSISRDLAENPRGMAPIMQHMFAGMIAGAAQCVVASPAEQVKVLLQVERGSANPLYKGPVDCTKYILKHSGLRGLYRGMSMTLARDTPAFGVYFWTYDIFKGWFEDRAAAAQAAEAKAAASTPRLGVSAAPATSAAGALTPSTAATPLLHSHTHHKEAATSIGAGAVALEDYNNSDNDITLGPLPLLLSGGVAGTMSWALFHPVDVLKSCIQALPADTPKHEASVVAIARDGYRAEGIAFFFRGYLATIARAFPCSAVTFLVYEWCKQGMEYMDF